MIIHNLDIWRNCGEESRKRLQLGTFAIDSLGSEMSSKNSYWYWYTGNEEQCTEFAGEGWNLPKLFWTLLNIFLISKSMNKFSSIIIKAKLTILFYQNENQTLPCKRHSFIAIKLFVQFLIFLFPLKFPIFRCIKIWNFDMIRCVDIFIILCSDDGPTTLMFNIQICQISQYYWNVCKQAGFWTRRIDARE